MDVYGCVIEESYERQGYRMGSTQAGVCVQSARQISEKEMLGRWKTWILICFMKS